jgi:hypothetical protein
VIFLKSFARKTLGKLTTDTKAKDESGTAIAVPIMSSGSKLISQLTNVFNEVQATNPENAPNWTKIPFQDHDDRKRLPEKKTSRTSSLNMGKWALKDYNVDVLYRDSEQLELLRTGKYIPQNKSSKPYNLNSFSQLNLVSNVAIREKVSQDIN